VAVTKINGFRAPYRSQTFQGIVNAQTQRNGVVQMAGKVSQSGFTITVPAFTFVQEGLLVTKDVATTLTTSSMGAPFYLVVSSPTASNIDNLVFTFAKSPADISSQEAIIAAWDGIEWRMLPFLSFDGVLDDVNQANIDFRRVGPFEGLNTAIDGLNYRNSAGTAVDKQGLRQTMLEDTLFPIPANDADWGRVDRVIYRRPNDSEDRIGVRRFFIGGAFDTAPGTLYNTQSFDATKVRQTTKVVVGSDNTAHFFVLAGYSGAYSVEYTKVASDRTTVLVAPTVIAANVGSTGFDVAIDTNNNLYLVYAFGGNIKWRKFDSVGSALTAELTVDAQSGRCINPKISIDPQNYKSYVVYQSLVAPGQDQVFMVTTDLGGTIATPSQNLTNDAFNTISPSLFVTDDFLVYVAWESLTETKVKYRVFDDVGAPLSAAVTVSGATNQIGVGTLVSGAKSPKIWVTDNKKVVVSFLQDKGGSVYGLSLWTEGSAFMQQLITAGEDFKSYDLYVDPVLNAYHLVLARTSSIDFVRVDLQAVLFTLNLAVTAASGLSTTRDALGAMITSWSSPLSAGFTSYDASESVLYIGLTTVVGSIATVNLAADECLVSSSILQAPKTGDRVIVTGSSAGNNGTYAITAVTLVSLNAPSDRYVIQVGAPFTSAENPAPAVNGDFQAPNGNETRYVKSTAETIAHAYTFDELDTDLLLSRVVMPGSIVLNYPVGGGSGVPGGGMEFLVPFGASVAIDWSATAAGTFTLSGGLKVLDLLNNFTYNLADGSYVMAEDQALYVVLDGSNFSPTPLVTNIATLPFAQPIQVLGVIKAGEFNPHLLSQGGLGQLDSGESVIFGNDLATDIRTRLGILSETSYESYTSVIGITASTDSYAKAISQTNIMAGQNKHVKLARAKLSWQKTGASELTFHTPGFVQVPGVTEARNEIAAQTILMGLDGDVAFVLLNRTAGAPATLAVSVSPVSGLPNYRDTLIIARRVGGNLVVEPNGLMVSPGSYAYCDEPLAAAKYSNESTNLNFHSAAVVGFEGVYGADTLAWDADLSISLPGRPTSYTVSAGSHELVDGECLYIEIPDDVPVVPIVPTVSAFTAVPTDPASVGYSPRIKVLWVRQGSTAHGLHRLPTVSSGETTKIGQELPLGVRSRLGITSESDTGFEAYTSTDVVALNDSHPTAISKLDAKAGLHGVHLTALQGQADTSSSSIVALFDAVSKLLGSEPIEETFVVGPGGQAVFAATLISWSDDSTSYDIMVFINGVKRELDPTLTVGFRKNSDIEIELAEAADEFARVTIRKTLAFKSPGYFVTYLTGYPGQAQSSTEPYSLGTDRLGVYRNGLYIMRSASLSDPVDRYLEQSGIAVELGLTAAPSEWFVFVHQKAAPSYKQFNSGLTGAVLTVPSFVLSSDRLRVYRNGILMNAAALGDPTLTYTETSVTSITLGAAALALDYYVFENTAAAPVWREDLDGVVGVTVTFSTTYVLGNARLLLFKNGQLLLNSTTLGIASERYQEATATTVTLETAAVATDVFTAIYQ